MTTLGNMVRGETLTFLWYMGCMSSDNIHVLELEHQAQNESAHNSSGDAANLNKQVNDMSNPRPLLADPLLLFGIGCCVQMCFFAICTMITGGFQSPPESTEFSSYLADFAASAAKQSVPENVGLPNSFYTGARILHGYSAYMPFHNYGNHPVNVMMRMGRCATYFSGDDEMVKKGVETGSKLLKSGLKSGPEGIYSYYDSDSDSD